MYELVVIEGDGIGHEVIPAAVEVLRAVLPGLVIRPAEAGWDCFRRTGTSVPRGTLEQIRNSGAALFGAVSSPSRKVEGYRSAVLTMRQELDLYANLRPVRSLPGCPRLDVDLTVVRENSEGLYAGRERLEVDGAVAERVITRAASQRIAAVAADLAARDARKRLTIVHKANVLPLTDGLFRDAVRTVVSERAPDVTVDEKLVDLAALDLVARPERFAVIVTTNLFGDILSDAAAHWCGGLGLAPSLNQGDDLALAEPVHGSAPDIAGKGLANPTAAILSAAMLLRHHWHRQEEADRILDAVTRTCLESLPIHTQTILERVLANLDANVEAAM